MFPVVLNEYGSKGSNSPRTISTSTILLEVLDKQIEVFKEYFLKPPGYSGQSTAFFETKNMQSWINIATRIKTALNSDSLDEETLPARIEELNKLKIPIGNSPLLSVACSLEAAERGAGLGFIAGVMGRGQRNNADTPSVIAGISQGIVVRAAFEENVLSKIVDELYDVRENYSNIEDKFHSLIFDTEQEASAVISKINKTSNEQIANIIEDAQAQSDQQKEEFSKIVSNFENLERKYRADIQIDTVVKFWEDKKKKHRKYSQCLWKCAGASGFVFVGILITLFFVEIQNDGGQIKIDSLQFWKSVGIALSVSTLLLWLTRILVRLAISQGHLAMDSDHRVAVASTYLSLLDEGTADESVLIDVLGVLFRPSSDGLVKDDDSPDFLTFFQKVVERK